MAKAGGFRAARLVNNGKEAVRIPQGFRLRHLIAIPKAPSDGAFVLGDRVRVRSSRRIGGEGSEGVVVSINLSLRETSHGEGWPPPRPYQVLLDDCPNRLLRFGHEELELTEF